MARDTDAKDANRGDPEHENRLFEDIEHETALLDDISVTNTVLKDDNGENTLQEDTETANTPLQDTKHESAESGLNTSRRTFLKATGAATAVTLSAGEATATSQTDPSNETMSSILSTDSQVDALINKLTLDEKIQLVHGTDYGKIEGYVPPVDKLDIPSFMLTDGPAGVRARAVATAFPAPIAVAAAWETTLANEFGAALGSENKAKNYDVLLGPNVNIARVPVNGRTFGAFGEDPYLTAETATQVIDGIQSMGVIATVKHYVANNQETNRRTVNEIIDDRTLHEIYLPAFKAAIQDASVGSIMAAYNKVNGTYCSQNRNLLTTIAEEQFGFDGYVVSDWGATHSTVTAATAGLDLEMPTGQYFDDDLQDAVKNGRVNGGLLDDKVRRILRARMAMGQLSDKQVGGPGLLDTQSHRTLARELAERGTVLLKNDDEELPLDADRNDSIAVVGPNATAPLSVAGGGSAHVSSSYAISPLEAITSRVEDERRVSYAQGTDPLSVGTDLSAVDAVPSSTLTPPDSDADGLHGKYFNNESFDGNPVLTQIDQQVSFDWSWYDGAGVNGSAVPLAPQLGAPFSVRWTGTFTPPGSGTYEFSLASHDGSRLFINGQRVVNNWGTHDLATESGTIHLSGGKDYDVRLEYRAADYPGQIKFGWQPPEGVTDSMIQHAADVAGDADVAVVFVDDYETEAIDRPAMGLGENQDRLVSAVADANDRTVVVLNTGAPITMPWVDDVSAVVEMWYPGQEDGNATTSVLFGDLNPSGKLPVTFGEQFEDYPANPTEHPERYPGENGVAHYSEGVFVGYRYFDQYGIEPLFPFGHGLSYTSFDYSGLSVTQNTNAHQENTVQAKLRVQNVGDRWGKETVQLYVSDPDASVDRPPKELKAFEKVTLGPDETTTVTFSLSTNAFSFYDTSTDGWVMEPGRFKILVGASSRDIRQQTSLTIRLSDTDQ